MEWIVIEKNRDYLLSPTEVWGIVEIQSELDSDEKNYIFKLINFVPFCPYKIDLKYFVNARNCFTTEEWIDVVISAIDYSPAGYKSTDEKLAVIKRLIPFVEKRVNLIELAPKETGKSYVFSQLSQYGWLVSGGSISSSSSSSLYKDYNLIFNYEAIQATPKAIKEIWGKDIEINGDDITWK